MEGFGSWSVLTTNFLIVLYIALNGVTMASIIHLVGGKWRFKVRYLACSLSVLFPIAFVLLVILLLNGEHTFQWLAHSAEAGAHDAHMPGWHNYTFLVTREIVGFFIITFLYGLFIKYQHLATIDPSYASQRKFRNVALLIPFGYVLYGTMVAWDFEMTMIPSWHSASYAPYHWISNFHFFLAFFSIFLFVVVRTGRLREEVPVKVFNYLAQWMFAFTILWTYLFFTQYIIMWYGRLPEEIVRFRNMMDNDLAVIWWTFLACKFIIPFCAFLFAYNRHTPKVIITVAAFICVGTWLERYTWISGSVPVEYYHLPMTSFFDIAVTAIIAVAAWFAMRWSLYRYGLLKAS